MTTTQGATRRLELLLARTPDMECADDLRVVLADAVLSRRLLDDARAQKPYGYEIDWPLSEGGVDKILTTDADDIEVARANRMEMLPVFTAPVPAQPAAPDFIPALYSWLARAHFDRQQDEVTASRFGQQLHAWITAQPAVCDDCGALCTPANNAKSHIKRCAACQSAFVASLDSAITAQSAAAPEAAVKDAAAILVQALEEIAWQRPLGVRPSKSGEAMERAAIIALHKYNALLSAADTRSPDKCQCNDDGKVTDACMDCPR